MRRVPVLLSVLAVMLLGLTAAARGAATAAQEGTPAADGPDLAGSWRVVLTFADGRTVLSLGTYGADGTAVSSGLPAMAAPPGAPPGVVFSSLAHGAWEATGPDTANITVVHLRANQEGQPLGTLTGRFAVTLDADGQTYRGDVESVLADPSGTEVVRFTGTVQATRMAAEAPGTPEAGTPAA